MNALQVNDFSFGYSDAPLFVNTSLCVESGSIVGLLGPNGSGKTTFFDIICGITNTKTINIKIDFKKILYLSQSITTPPMLRMFDIFKMTTLLVCSELVSRQRALEKLQAWSPEIIERYMAIWNKKSGLCSYGEKRWFFTLTLLALDADLVILDEPSAGVDPEFRYYIWKCLAGAARDGTAVLVSSHNIEEIVAHCDRFYMISNRTFTPFQSGEQFKKHYQASSMDEAFIHAAAISDR